MAFRRKLLVLETYTLSALEIERAGTEGYDRGDGVDGGRRILVPLRSESVGFLPLIGV